MVATFRIPPGPKGAPLLGSMLAFRRDPTGFILRVGNQYGDVVRYRLGGHTVYFLRHPDHVKEVLVTRQHDFAKGRGLEWARLFLGDGLLTSEGEVHVRQRRLMQPAFHRQHVAAYADVMTGYAARLRERWQPGAEIDVHREMMALTLAIAGQTLFGFEFAGPETEQVGEALADLMRPFHRFALPLPGLVHKLPLPSNRRFDRAIRQMDALVYRMIRERRESPGERHDLMQALLEARDHEGDGTGMSDRQLRDEAVTLLLAGHETTANALSWTFYLLAQQPEAEARLHAELDAVLGGRLPAVDDLPKLGFTERVFAESLRLYPPAWGLGRRALRTLEVGGWTIPEGTLIHLSPWATQRDARFWPDPERFDPERFTAEAKAARPRFAYFPFGAGARQCIGEPFAWMEGVLVLATLAQRHRLTLVPGHRVEPEPLVTLRPRYGIRMRVA